MTNIVTTGAAERMMAFRTNTPGRCLLYEWQAVGQGNHYTGGGAANAYATWLAIPEQYRHVGDRNVPKDMPAFFGVRPSTGNNEGDVIVSFGDGTFAATDYPQGHLGRPTLSQRGVEIGRVYLGWADFQGGYTLTSSAWAGGGIAPLPPDPNPYRRKASSMSTLYSSVIPAAIPAEYAAAGYKAGQTIFGWAGDGVGSAAWLETGDQGLANAIAGAHHINGLAVGLGWPSYLNWKAAYRTAQPTSGGGSTGGGSVDLSPVLAAIAEIPTAPENGAASRDAIVK